MKTLMTILVLSGLAVSQTTQTNCVKSGDYIDCTTKEEKQMYYDGYGCYGYADCFETPTEHANRIANWRAAQQAQAEAKQRQAEAEQRQREAHEAWLATPEGQRQARLEFEAKQRQEAAREQAAAEQEEAVEQITRKTWMGTHSQYKQTEANNTLMIQYIRGHGLYLGKTKSYDKAFKTLSKAGLLEK